MSVWEKRTDIPQEYFELKDHLKEIFQKRFDEKKSQSKKEQEEYERQEQEKIEKYGQALFTRNKDLIDKFLDIAERKVSTIDDYGDENWGILPNEIEVCIKKITEKEGLAIDWQAHRKAKKRGYFSYSSETLPDEYYWLQDKLEELFRAYHAEQSYKATDITEVNGLSGVEFETWISKLLKENGYDDVRGTSTTGDQGADLIAKRDGKTIVIQAKRYNGSVGNKAVQEVISALSFYKGDEGWVVTNSSFTPSAKALAHKANIRLIDGKDLEKGIELFSNE